MRDPISSNFDWSSLYKEYDATCKRFDPQAPSLLTFVSKPRNDRYLYYALMDRIAHEKSKNGFIGLGTYEGILYWKLYSQPAAVKNICLRIREETNLQRDIQRRLESLGDQLPRVLCEDIAQVSNAYQIVHNLP